jgi:hypothetical protein
MSDHQSALQDRIENESSRQQAREALRRQVMIWVTRTIPPHPQHPAPPPGNSFVYPLAQSR